MDPNHLWNLLHFQHPLGLDEADDHAIEDEQTFVRSRILTNISYFDAALANKSQHIQCILLPISDALSTVDPHSAELSTLPQSQIASRLNLQAVTDLHQLNYDLKILWSLLEVIY